MKVLVFNCGSSSIKYQLINMEDEHVYASGGLERVGLSNSLLKHEKDGEKFKIPCEISDHKQGIAFILDKMTSGETKVIDNIQEINAIGHRVVHGGEQFSESVLIDEGILNSLKDCIPLAPLHNPANITGIEACAELLPEEPQVAVFDTAFHQTMEPFVYLYAIPYEFYDQYKIRRYGFHGTSHKYVSQRAAEIVGKKVEDLKIITCHLGNGASICAVNQGKSMDTSMGFTPLEGLMMGTRSGSVDPAVPLFLQKKENFTPEEMENFLNKKSGVLGLTGISSDMRDIENAAWNEKNEKAQLALDKYHYMIIKYIGGYVAAMNGVDLIVFTGGVGEYGPESREEIMKYLTYLGISLDAESNKKRGHEVQISTPDSKVTVLVVPTNEELMIARDTKILVDQL